MDQLGKVEKIESEEPEFFQKDQNALLSFRQPQVEEQIVSELPLHLVKHVIHLVLDLFESALTDQIVHFPQNLSEEHEGVSIIEERGEVIISVLDLPQSDYGKGPHDSVLQSLVGENVFEVDLEIAYELVGGAEEVIGQFG